MSRIYSMDLLADRYKDNNFKEREIKAFEIKFPEARIIKEKYSSEAQLDEDWQKYCGLPYHLKVLCNERSLRLFGWKNEQQYIKLKSEFAKRDIADVKTYVYTPMGFTEAVNDDILIKQAKDYMNSGGRSILLIDYDNLADLNTDWYNFNNQCYDHKVIANNKSLEIYGKTVPEVYQREVKKFLVKDIDNSSLDNLMTRRVVNDSIYATEAVVEQAELSLDNVESIMLVEMAMNQVYSPVENTLVDQLKKNINDQIKEEGIFTEDRFGRYNYLLPWEVMGLFEDVEELCRDPYFMNYYMRGIGFKPLAESYHEVIRQKLLTEDIDKLLVIGWNPVLDPKDENNHIIASHRANEALREYCKYWFFNLENTPNLLIEDENNDTFHKGISILIIQELDRDNEDKVEDLPKVLVTLDYRTASWHPITYGQISSMQRTVDNIISQFKIPLVTCYFLGLSDGLYDRIKDINIEEFNTNNEIQRICNIVRTEYPNIANKKLFVTYLLSSLMHSKYGENVFPLRFDHDSQKEVVLTLYSKLFGNYREIEQAFSKLHLFDEDKANLQETFIFKDSKLKAEYEDENEDYIGINDFSKDQVYTETWQDFQRLLNIQPNI